MMKAVFGIVLLVATNLMAATQTVAFSGAEFLSTSEDFADGYAWGIAETRANVAWSMDPAYLEEMRQVWECMSRAGITSSIFGDAVRSTIREEAALLTTPASSAVLRTLSDMCPVVP